MKTKGYLLFVLIALSSILSNFAQGGCGLGVYAGEDQTINCGDCTNISAVSNDVNLAIGDDTTSYTIGNDFCTPLAVPPTATGIDVDDRWSNTINIGFDFSFFGNTYNQLLIGDNGVVTFDLVNNTPGGYCEWHFTDDIPSSNLFPLTIFGAYHDLLTEVSIGGGGTIEYFVSGTAPYRQFVVTYTDVFHYENRGDGDDYTCNETTTQQIILQETTNIISINLIHKPVVCDNWNGSRALVGIQNASGTFGYAATGRQTSDSPWVADDEVWQFLPVNPTPADIVFDGWYDSNNVQVSTNETTTVCPTDTETYTARYTCANCDINPVTVSDDVVINVANTLDTDGDGICDNIDVDDDNDGITDVMECVDETVYGPFNDQNTSFDITGTGNND
jgi:hypothetical protein